jgi:hypothetical protein
MIVLQLALHHLHKADSSLVLRAQLELEILLVARDEVVLEDHLCRESRESRGRMKE